MSFWPFINTRDVQMDRHKEFKKRENDIKFRENREKFTVNFVKSLDNDNNLNYNCIKFREIVLARS